MTKHSEIAKGLFLEGYNCAQSVFAAFADEYGMERTQALRIASSFGGGMGGMREVCGAVSGMLMAAGLLFGYDSADDPAAKKAHYALVRRLADAFSAQTGSIVCRELLTGAGLRVQTEPSARTEAYYKKRPCPELVELAARILDDHLQDPQREDTPCRHGMHP